MSVCNTSSLPTAFPVGTSSFRDFAAFRLKSGSPALRVASGKLHTMEATGSSLLNTEHRELAISGLNPGLLQVSTSRSGTATPLPTKSTPHQAQAQQLRAR